MGREYRVGDEIRKTRTTRLTLVNRRCGRWYVANEENHRRLYSPGHIGDAIGRGF